MKRSQRIITFIALLLPVLLLAVYSFLQTRSQIIDQVYDERKGLASVTARILHEKLDRVAEVGQSVAKWPSIREAFAAGHAGHIAELMGTITRDFPYVSNVLITDTTGTTVTAAKDTGGYRELLSHLAPVLSQVKAPGKPVFSGIYHPGKIPEQYNSLLVVGIENPANRLVGSLVFVIDLNHLLEWSDEINVGRSGSVYIIDPQGRLAYNSWRYPESGITDFGILPEVKKLLQGQSNAVLLNEPNSKKEHLFAYEQVPKYGWGVIVQERADAAFSRNNSIRSVFVFYCLFVLLATGLVWIILKGLVRQRKTEIDLKQTNENIHLLIDNVKDYAIFMIDQDGNVKNWNNGATSITGYSENEIIGHSFTVFYTPCDIEAGTPAKYLSTARQQGHFETEGWQVRKEGQLFFASIVFTALYNEQQQVYGFSLVCRDISDRKKAQEELELLSLQINQSDEAIYTLDSERRVRSWNLGAEKLYGYTHDEMLGKEPNAVLQTALTPSEINEYTNSIGRDGHLTLEIKRKTKTGQDVFVHASTTTIKNETGNITGYISVNLDLTHQRKLLEQVNHLADIVEQSSEAIMSESLDKHIISWNRGAEILFGYPKKEVIGKKTGELGFVNFTVEEMAAFERNMIVEGSWHHEKKYYRKNGSSFYGRLTANSVKNTEGEVTATVYIITDITSRKLLEEQLKNANDELEKKVKERTAEISASEKKFRTLIENNNDVITLMDRSYRLIYRSPAACRVTGWSDQEMLGVDATSNLHPDDLPVVKLTVQDVLKNPGKSINLLYRTLHKKGNYLWIEGTLTNWLHDASVQAIVFNFRDVTERVEAGERMAASEKRFRTLIENNQDVILLLDKDMNIQYRSPSATRVNGWTDEDVKTMSPFSNVHPDDVPYSKGIIKKLQENPGLQVPIRVRNKHKNGHYIWLEGVATNLLNDHNVKAYLFNFRDISQELADKEKLVEQKAQLEALGDNLSGVMIYQLELDHNGKRRFNYVSNGVTLLTGKKPEEVMEDPSILYNLILEEDRAAFLAAEQAAISQKKIFNTEVRCKTRTGEIRWLNIVSTPRTTPDGRLVWDGFHLDVTDRREAGRQLADSEARFRSLIENITDAIVLNDADMNILYQSPSVSKILGYKPEERKDRKVIDYVHPDFRNDFEELYRQLKVKKNEPLPFQYRFLHKSGKYVWLEGVVTNLLDNPLVGAYVANYRNISERKEAEEKIHRLNEELELKILQRTAQLKKSNEELESFSYSVSHDLRAPLRGIIGFTSILEEEYGSQLDAEAKRITGIIKDNTLKMGNLIDDLLTFSRTGRQQLEKRWINTDNMLSEVIAGIDFKHAGQLIEWHTAPLQDTFADASSLRQVWINLVSNAVKYSSRSTQPKITTGSYRTKDETVFFIKDNGVGFDEKYADKLFKVFQRLHSGSEFDGTGVGLAIVEKIVSKHGGRVWAEAKVNEGAAFYFSLPNPPQKDH